MIAILVDTCDNIKIVNITPKDLNDFEGYAPIDPNFNISIFVKNFNDSNKRPLNKIATDIYESHIFGSVYITLEPKYESEDESEDESEEIKELTYKYYEVLKNKYN